MPACGPRPLLRVNQQPHFLIGGGERIRTSDDVAAILVFETSPFGHSGTPPRRNSSYCPSFEYLKTFYVLAFLLSKFLRNLVFKCLTKLCPWADSNGQPFPSQGNVLSIELQGHVISDKLYQF